MLMSYQVRDKEVLVTSVTRMEFDATPVAIRIGAVTIMTMISFK